MGLFVREETCCIFSPLLSLAILMVYEGTINIMRGTINSQLYCSTMQYITHPAHQGIRKLDPNSWEHLKMGREYRKRWY